MITGETRKTIFTDEEIQFHQQELRVHKDQLLKLYQQNTKKQTQSLEEKPENAEKLNTKEKQNGNPDQKKRKGSGQQKARKNSHHKEEEKHTSEILRDVDFVVIIPMLLPGSGKTHLGQILQKLVEAQEDKFEFFYFEDEIKKFIEEQNSQDGNQNGNSTNSHSLQEEEEINEIFQTRFRQIEDQYFRRVRNYINAKFTEQQTPELKEALPPVFYIFLDKCVYPLELSRLEENIKRQEESRKGHARIHFATVIQNRQQDALTQRLKLPFSTNFILNCLQRLVWNFSNNEYSRIYGERDYDALEFIIQEICKFKGFTGTEQRFKLNKVDLVHQVDFCEQGDLEFVKNDNLLQVLSKLLQDCVPYEVCRQQKLVEQLKIEYKRELDLEGKGFFRQENSCSLTKGSLHQAAKFIQKCNTMVFNRENLQSRLERKQVTINEEGNQSEPSQKHFLFAKERSIPKFLGYLILKQKPAIQAYIQRCLDLIHSSFPNRLRMDCSQVEAQLKDSSWVALKYLTGYDESELEDLRTFQKGRNMQFELNALLVIDSKLIMGLILDPEGESVDPENGQGSSQIRSLNLIMENWEARKSLVVIEELKRFKFVRQLLEDGLDESSSMVRLVHLNLDHGVSDIQEAYFVKPATCITLEGVSSVYLKENSQHSNKYNNNFQQNKRKGSFNKNHR